ncbi:hypothetical protein L332_03420 [Agrococcus pavilionensis RW1]|uniref:Uncharacterized protein n=1 Tax=Agrococcus pavilionensis RW1 TaxID=1330458 RepID=U1MS61_9MICO|nr:hypothetical protein [Agrococcus pavilionensis]ERG63505.1 hypothetical protein L332_03420 [Agrococcus pavilionensis RW1]
MSIWIRPVGDEGGPWLEAGGFVDVGPTFEPEQEPWSWSEESKPVPASFSFELDVEVESKWLWRTLGGERRIEKRRRLRFERSALRARKERRARRRRMQRLAIGLPGVKD